LCYLYTQINQFIIISEKYSFIDLACNSHDCCTRDFLAGNNADASVEISESFTEILYGEIGLANQSYPAYAVFAMAMNGYQNLKASKKLKKEILTVIDFSMSSNEKRLVGD
jgi:hypothetical protein